MRRHSRQRIYWGAICCCAPLWAIASDPDASTTTVYRSVGPNGVVSFSDSPRPEAVPIEVIPPPSPLEADVERANRMFEQQLALLEVLETHRQARAKEEIEQRRLDLDFVRTQAEFEQARDQEAQQSDTRFYPLFWGGWGPNRPWINPRPPKMDRPKPLPEPPPRQIQFPHSP